MKLSEFLNNYDSHGIYDHVKIAEKFQHEFNEEPCWPKHTVGQTRESIANDPRGGDVKGEPSKLVCYGYEMANALARKYADFYSDKIGRGFLFRDCIAALERAGK